MWALSLSMVCKHYHSLIRELNDHLTIDTGSAKRYDLHLKSKQYNADLSLYSTIRSLEITGISLEGDHKDLIAARNLFKNAHFRRMVSQSLTKVKAYKCLVLDALVTGCGGIPTLTDIDVTADLGIIKEKHFYFVKGTDNVKRLRLLVVDNDGDQDLIFAKAIVGFSNLSLPTRKMLSGLTSFTLEGSGLFNHIAQEEESNALVDNIHKFMPLLTELKLITTEFSRDDDVDDDDDEPKGGLEILAENVLNLLKGNPQITSLAFIMPLSWASQYHIVRPLFEYLLTDPSCSVQCLSLGVTKDFEDTVIVPPLTRQIDSLSLLYTSETPMFASGRDEKPSWYLNLLTKDRYGCFNLVKDLTFLVWPEETSQDNFKFMALAILNNTDTKIFNIGITDDGDKRYIDVNANLDKEESELFYFVEGNPGVKRLRLHAMDDEGEDKDVIFSKRIMDFSKLTLPTRNLLSKITSFTLQDEYLGEYLLDSTRPKFLFDNIRRYMPMLTELRLICSLIVSEVDKLQENLLAYLKNSHLVTSFALQIPIVSGLHHQSRPLLEYFLTDQTCHIQHLSLCVATDQDGTFMLPPIARYIDSLSLFYMDTLDYSYHSDNAVSKSLRYALVSGCGISTLTDIHVTANLDKEETELFYFVEGNPGVKLLRLHTTSEEGEDKDTIFSNHIMDFSKLTLPTRNLLSSITSFTLDDDEYLGEYLFDGTRAKTLFNNIKSYMPMLTDLSLISKQRNEADTIQEHLLGYLKSSQLVTSFTLLIPPKKMETYPEATMEGLGIDKKRFFDIAASVIRNNTETKIYSIIFQNDSEHSDKEEMESQATQDTQSLVDAINSNHSLTHIYLDSQFHIYN
eukprot:gene8419-9904_t